jgi:hypothetical protein
MGDVPGPGVDRAGGEGTRRPPARQSAYFFTMFQKTVSGVSMTSLRRSFR